MQFSSISKPGPLVRTLVLSDACPETPESALSVAGSGQSLGLASPCLHLCALVCWSLGLQKVFLPIVLLHSPRPLLLDSSSTIVPVTVPTVELTLGLALCFSPVLLCS